MLEFVVFVVFTDAGNRADLMEAIRVNDLVDALANGEPTLVMLTLDLVNASHLPRERFAPGEVVEFRLPVHSSPPSSLFYCCYGCHCVPAPAALFFPACW